MFRKLLHKIILIFSKKEKRNYERDKITAENMVMQKRMKNKDWY